jgi:hypothetical protein
MEGVTSSILVPPTNSRYNGVLYGTPFFFVRIRRQAWFICG